MTPGDLLTSIVRPTLALLGLSSIPAEQILIGTCAQESQFRDIPQDDGPALGYWQMEPATHNDVWASWLAYKFHFAAIVRGLLPAGAAPTADKLIPFPAYACAMARLVYERAPGAIPADLAGQAAYYKAHYNTPLGAATATEYVNNWKRLVAPVAADLWPAAPGT